MDRLRIYFRQHQFFSPLDSITPVVIQCNGSNVAEYVNGIVPLHEWIEMTQFTDREGIEKMGLNWDAINSGDSTNTETNQTGSNYDKGISLELTFSDIAYNYIYDWLMNNDCSVLNAIDVKIVDSLCDKTYRLFEIKADNLTYMPRDNPCQFTVRLREQDLVWHWVHKTMIWDNWQNWFQYVDEDDPGYAAAKKHPTFLTCLDPRPRLLGSLKAGIVLYQISMPFHFAGGNDNDGRKALGIDHFQPAPLIRDILLNFCLRFGMQMDTIFDDKPGNDYKNICLYFPQSGYYNKVNTDDVIAHNLTYIFENRWNVTIADLLDRLKVVFNAEWCVTPNNTLVFKTKLQLIQSAIIYDFTISSLPVWELTYSFNADKKAAYGRYQYQTDESASLEISTLYNDIVDYDQKSLNVMLEGERNKNVEFGSTGFVRDGRIEDIKSADKDYILRLIKDGKLIATILVAIMLVMGVVIAWNHPIIATAWIILNADWLVNINNHHFDWIHLFCNEPTVQENIYTGAVRVTLETLSQPRLLLWDGVSMARAKVVVTDTTTLTPDPFFNPTSKIYTDLNHINDEGNLFNYPMYFESMFHGNLYDRFHNAIDNPLYSKETHQDFTFYTDLCCEVLTTFGVWENDSIKIGSIIKIEQRVNYSVFGRIEKIEVDYDGNKVKFKGKVLKRI